MKSCLDCKKDHYPRVDPVIITLIINGTNCLLCRLPTSPKKRYSCVAGFLEPGETIEECVQREVFEEVGVKLDRKRIKYILSDPWPTEIGSNLMIGCQAYIDTTDFKVNLEELEDARWFKMDEVKEILAKEKEDHEFNLPGHYTTAYKLLKYWTSDNFNLQ